MTKHLQRDIETLKNKIIAMGGEVEDRLYQATLSVINWDEGMAQSVINGDSEIDRMEVEIEEDCLKVLALFQPVAVDLRFLVAVLKINNDLERIGDLAVNIAERAVYLATHDRIELPFDISRMATKVESMVSRSIDAMVNFDVKMAYKIRAEDEEVDEYNRMMYATVKEMIPKNLDNVSSILHAMSIGRHLERIADHATNIAEDIIYLVDATIVRHWPEVYEE